MEKFKTESWLKVSQTVGKVQSAYFMQKRSGWLEIADAAVELTPKFLPALYQALSFFYLLILLISGGKVPEAQTVAALIYLDWIARSPLALEIFGTSQQSKRETITFDLDNEEGNQSLDKAARIALLHKRLATIRDCISELNKLASACAGNYMHKVNN